MKIGNIEESVNAKIFWLNLCKSVMSARMKILITTGVRLFVTLCNEH